MPAITFQNIMDGLVDAAKDSQASKAWDKLDVPIEHSGRAITLPIDPSRMPLEKAREAIDRRIKDESQPFIVAERFDAFPHDAAVAFVKAMNKLYGWSSPQTVMTFFGPKPPTMLTVKTGLKSEDVIQCPFGAFKLPGIENTIHTGFDDDVGAGPYFYIRAEVKKRDRHLLVELANETRRILKNESIYKGKAIRLGVDSSGSLNLNDPPQFMDVGNTTESSLLFDEDTEAQINTNILTPIKQTALCKKLGIPIKRGVLLEGPFGTGKSLTARMTGNVCEQNNWTFVLLDKVQGLKVALEFANKYAPAVVFAEDIDRIACDRDEEMNDLVNTIDGVISKTSQVMTILTTNFVEKLNPVILRPGRLDAVISLRPPNAETVKKLISYYAGKLLPASVTLTEAGKELKGQIPASIRECVERAKLGMISRGESKALSEHDIIIAAKTMKNHLALLNGKKPEPSAADRLASALVEVLNGSAEDVSINGKLTDLYELTDSVDDKSISLIRKSEKILEAIENQ